MKKIISPGANMPVYLFSKKRLGLMLVLAGCLMASTVAAVPELTINGPLVPGQIVPSAEGADLVLNIGSSIVYTTSGIMHVYLPDGSEQFTAPESNATRIHFVNDDIPGEEYAKATHVLRIDQPAIFMQGSKHGFRIIGSGNYQNIIVLRDDVEPSIPVQYFFGDTDNVYTQITESEGIMSVGDGYRIVHEG